MKELTHEDWMKNPTPRMMWIWDDDETKKKKRKVIYFLEHGVTYPVIALNDANIGVSIYKRCAEIEKARRMTNKELSWWLSEKPHRELKISGYIYHAYDYKENEQDAEVTDLILIRENDGDWKEPLVELEE